MKPRDIPNVITGGRILLTVPVVWLLLEESYSEALALFFVAGASDGLDGFLAKRYGWSSRLGSILDPLADKLLVISTILVLGWQEVLPAWLVVLVVLRDVIIVSGALSYHYWIGTFRAEPLLISRINTLMQLVLVFAVVFDRAVLALPEPLLTLGIYLTGLTTAMSGIAYIGTWGRRALRDASR